MNTTTQLSTERLVKLARITKTPEEFVSDILKFPKWYLQTEFLKRQTKAYFYQFYNDFKRVK